LVTPNNQATLNQYDADVGSGGVALLPDQTSGPPDLLVQGGKQGRTYVLNRDSMGNFNRQAIMSCRNSGQIRVLGRPRPSGKTRFILPVRAIMVAAIR